MKLPGRDLSPDIRYGSKLVEKFTNYIMADGKQGVAQRIVYDALALAEKRSGTPALELFTEAVACCSPLLAVRTRRVGGANYQVPYEVSPSRRIALALRWITQAAQTRGEKRMVERIAGEILEASRKEGKAYSKKLEAHRMAESNKAFAHYRW
jgi:small subunit ribosomal protein S7